MYVTPSPQLSNSFNAGTTQNVAGKRIYEVWKGSNIFFCGGRLIFGPDVRSLLVTLVLIIGPVTIFCVFVGRHLRKDYSNGVAIMIILVIHTFIVLVFLLLTSGRDPGIIPRNAHPPEPEEEMNSPSEWSGGQTPKLRLPRTKDVIVNGVTVKIKYCDTCMLYRPPRCSHCSICNNCVERFDHHCPWVGQCIGRRNYPFFFMFVFSTTLLCFFVFAMCALRIKKLMEGDPPHTVWKALQRSPASAFLMAYVFLATWFVGGLTVFHMYLIGTNQTTYENFRYRYDNKANPYHEGLLRNFKLVLFSGIPPSKNKFRSKVQLEVPNIVPTVQSRESIDILSPNRKAVDDIDIGDKSAWSTLVGAEAYQDVHARNSTNGSGNKVLKHGYEDAFAEALGGEGSRGGAFRAPVSGSNR
ncbi:hypothetical protein KP509_27G054200 [Ceratopteris richardii]|uniref:S-acyltransferase n=1 Tax=Ceratopteris richardii TaxID=49495 RepID=A0A8T2RJ26_CERRI|nr:hypothetical protein KP509_27G054200 [Ceratopteris richardii]